MARLADVRKPSDTQRSRVLLEPRLADLFRRVRKHLNREADDVFEEMLLLFIEERTNLEPIYEQTRRPPAVAKDERRTTGKRRGRGHPRTGKPIPGADQPGVTRRKATSDRRKKR